MRFSFLTSWKDHEKSHGIPKFHGFPILNTSNLWEITVSFKAACLEHPENVPYCLSIYKRIIAMMTEIPPIYFIPWKKKPRGITVSTMTT